MEKNIYALEDRSRMSIVVTYCIVSFIVWLQWRNRRCRKRHIVSDVTLCLMYSGAFLLPPADAAGQDTVRALDEVEISSQRPPSTMRTATPTQVVDASSIEKLGALQLSDAVRQMAGVTLKDYGGVGGMKTVSARGLGSQFSTVTIDGVAVNDAQNGQVDLGRYLLGNAAYVSLSQGQQQTGLLSARAYAAGNVLNLETAEPSFFAAERTNLKASFEAGSFGMLNPSAQWEQRWSRRLKSSLWVNWLSSDGDYPFTLYYTGNRDDSSSTERRRHSAMHMLTTDANIFFRIADSNRLSAKLHYMGGRHQLPGPVQLYKQSPSAQSTREEVLFAQARWTVDRRRWSSQLMGKVQSTYDLYEDSAASTRTRYLMNDYRQREAYLSGSAVYHLARWIDLSAAVDGSLASLRTNLALRNDVNRENLMTVAALRLHQQDSNLNSIELRANLLGTMICDRVADLDTMPLYRRLSPFVGLTVTYGGRLTLRYFYKETYRAPNFSELYFFAMPRDLAPERARQHNVGLTYTGRALAATIDAYHNRVSDKILAIPTQNMFLWSMQNIGRVHILGLDATLSLQLSDLSLQLNYTYQHAVDRSDPCGPTYGHQIAYTPRHSGGGTLRWENRWVNLGATAMVVGERYYRMQNSPEYLLAPYCDLGLSADRSIDLPWGTLRLQVQVLNILDVQYEVVRSYPMMGRNVRFKVSFEL